MKLWNPSTFFISLIMSGIMPLIFAVPYGMPVAICLERWPLRFVVAYFLSVIFVDDLALKLAVKTFGFEARDKVGVWNPFIFFKSLQMILLMPAIFGLTTRLPIQRYFLLMPLRWIIAYAINNFIATRLGNYLAEKIFKNNSMIENEY